MGITRRVQCGRETWTIRSYRFRRPPWRANDPDLGFIDPDEMGLFVPAGLILWLLVAPVSYILVPLLVFPVELGWRGLTALLTTERWVEAACEAPPARMTWLTDAEHEQPVVEQVARQLELGYAKIEPHRADFLGFA